MDNLIYYYYIETIIVLIGFLMLPVAILIESKKRTGRILWGWAIGVFIVTGMYLGNMYSQQSHHEFEIVSSTVDNVFKLFVFLVAFGIYRFATRKKNSKM